MSIKVNSDIAYYRQCILKKGITSDVAWIPESFAILNKYVNIKGDNGWKVTSVSTRRVSGTYLKEHERNYLTQREASDI